MSANTCSHVGMLSVGTKAELAKVRGKSQMKPADWTASTVFMLSAMTTPIHENANDVSSSSMKATSCAPTDPSGRKPTSTPTMYMTPTTAALRTRSDTVRPTSTADRAMGSERNLSMMPLRRSSARPMPLATAPKATVCAKIPGIR